MDIISFLERLANSTHNSKHSNDLLSLQTDAVKHAFITNDAYLLKKQLSDTTYYADKTGVVQA